MEEIKVQENKVSDKEHCREIESQREENDKISTRIKSGLHKKRS